MKQGVINKTKGSGLFPTGLSIHHYDFLQRIVSYINIIGKSILRQIDGAKTKIIDLMSSDPDFSPSDIIQQIIDGIKDLISFTIQQIGFVTTEMNNLMPIDPNISPNNFRRQIVDQNFKHQSLLRRQDSDSTAEIGLLALTAFGKKILKKRNLTMLGY